MSTRPTTHESLIVLAGKLGERLDTASTLDAVTTSAMRSVPGLRGASVSLLEAGEAPRTVAPTNRLVEEVDRLQHDLREGPSHDVLDGTHSAVVAVMSDGSPWPNFTPRALSRGVGAVMSFEIADEPRRRAALNLYVEGDVLQEHTVELARLVAAHAAVSVGLVERIRQLEQGLQSRSVISEAVGILMERYALRSERAFRLLVRLSNQSNTKVRDIAATVVREQQERSESGPGDARARPPRPLRPRPASRTSSPGRPT